MIGTSLTNNMIGSVAPHRLHLKRLVCPKDFSLPEGVVLQQGLSQTLKTIPPKYFYDDRGSELFEQICTLPEYYVTTTEVSILKAHAPTIVKQTGTCELVELGSGSSLKTHILLDAYQNAGMPLHYTPIDISASILEASAQHLLTDYPQLQIHGIVGTYEQALENLTPSPLPCRLIYFLGSSLGNLNSQECDQFFDRVGNSLSTGDYFLLGVDLQKSPSQLEAAYNDAQGVTAAFNLNMLHHLNRRFGGDFDVEQFSHFARYDTTLHQIEMYLESIIDQTVHFQGIELEIELKAEERILTEISRKFNLKQLCLELESKGFHRVQTWTDDREWFGLLLGQKR